MHLNNPNTTHNLRHGVSPLPRCDDRVYKPQGVPNTHNIVLCVKNGTPTNGAGAGCQRLMIDGCGQKQRAQNHNLGYNQKVTKRVRKQATATANATRECRRLADSRIYPKMNRLFSSIDNTMRNCLMVVYGEIDNDPKLPKNKKEELKNAIRKGLPPREPLMLPFEYE